MSEPTEVLPSTPPPPESGPLRPRRARMRTRTRVLIVAGGALLVVLAVIAGALVAQRIADDERRAAQQQLADDEAALAAATSRADAAADDLDTRIAATDDALAISGAGLDDAARPALQTARDEAAAAAEADGGDDSLPDDTEGVTERATRLEDAVTALDEAITAYLDAATATGSALLTDRSDAADDVKASLESQLDALPASDPGDVVATLTAYRAAVDAVIASSDAARVPATPGGSGVRITDPSSLQVVVNKRRGLPADYVPPGLTTPANIPGATQVRSELIAPLERMRVDMAAAGITLRMSSAYRSYARQQTIYNGFVASEGVAGADTHSARPGNSEHQTGLAVDLDDGTGCNLNACFANTPGGKWLAENAWKYGFILRYGDGWQPVVGYTYEPWHFRFVGVDVATDMHDRGIRTLEEYYGLPAAPDYG